MRFQTLSEARWIFAALVLLGVISYFTSLWLLWPIFLLLVYTIWFFRDPDRVAPTDPDAVLASADGTVADIIEIDLLVAIDLCRLAAPLLLDRPGASVINISSIFGQISSGGGMAGYHAAKGGLITFTRHLAEQWGQHGVRVNALAPGFFPTPLTGELADPDQRQRICRRTLLRRVPDIAEIDGRWRITHRAVDNDWRRGPYPPMV